MSSTGKIYKSSQAVTSTGERSRQNASDSPDSELERIRIEMGEISEVHTQQTLIRAIASNGSPLANGNWIPMSHSPREISERFGTIQKRMGVVVYFSGTGNNAIATIIREVGEKIADIQEENKLKRGLYRIMAPGVGFG